jgi:hypothetical protein
MRRRVKVAAGGVLLSVVNFAAGAAAYGWFAARSLGDWNRLVQLRFAIEQEARATRAERRGDLLEALHRRWNVVDAESGRGWLHEFDTWKPPVFLVPSEFANLLEVYEGDPNAECPVTDVSCGRNASLAIAHGQLARLLEMFEPARAADQWKTATTVAGYPDEARTKKLIGFMQEHDANKFQVQLEDAVLGPTKE